MSTVRRPPPLLFQREVDPQPIWPVMLAIGILTVSAAAMIVSTLGFDDARPYQNAVFWLWLLVASASGFVALSIGTRNQLTRRMQTAIVVSVMIHMILAMVLNEQAITVLVTDRPAVSKQVKPLPTIPDYFVPLPNASNENAFERPVETETVHLRTESRERQQEVPKAETPQKQRAEMEALQAVTSPAELQRNDQPTPRRAELLSKLSRQDLTQARISPQPIRAPSESLGQQSKQRIDAPAANAARRQPQQPRLTRRRREPSDSDAQAAVGAPQLAKASPNPPIANRETARLSTPRQIAPGGLAATRARDIAPAVDPAPASENMSSRLAATNTPRLSRNTPTRQPSQTRSRHRAVSSMANASEVASTAMLSSRATPTRRSVTTVNQNASPESLATNRSSAALAQTRATAPAAASDDAQVAATHGESHLQPETGGNRMARRSPMGPAARRGRRGSGAGESTDSLESLAATSESGIQRALGPSRPAEIGRGAPTGSLGSLGVTPQRSSVAEISDEDSGAGDLPTDTNVGQSPLASSEGAANLPGPPAGGLSRASSRIPSRSRAPADMGGISLQANAETGLPSRRASTQSLVTNDAPQRFLNRASRTTASVSGQARDIAPAFARRIARRSDPTRRGEGHNSPEVEATIERGLVYLASIQRRDGRWSLQSTTAAGSDPEDNRAVIYADSAATGLSLLAFLGAGYDHIDEEYADTVREGLQFLLANQQPNGDLYMPQSGPANEGIWFYSHGIAAIALCEAYGMTGDEDLREPAQRALNFIVQAQEPERGGWRYEPRSMSDLSVSGWQLMALRSGQLAGLKVPGRAIARTRQLLDRAQASGENPSEYVYNPWGNDTERGRYGPRPNTVMTAVGLLMRLYTGWDRENAAIQNGADRLLQHLPEMKQPPAYAGRDNPQRDTYYWYNATQVMFHMQGTHWQKWRDRLYPMLAETQVKEGDLAGSWDPRQPVVDRWASSAGRLYLTALNLLSLEVTHRHLPLFDSGLSVTR